MVILHLITTLQELFQMIMERLGKRIKSSLILHLVLLFICLASVVVQALHTCVIKI